MKGRDVLVDGIGLINIKEMFSSREAATLTGLSSSFFRKDRARSSPRIGYIRCGGKCLYSAKDLAALGRPKYVPGASDTDTGAAA